MNDPRAERLDATILAAERSHKDLEACIAGVRAVASAANQENLGQPLKILHAALKEHFAHEEKSALYGWVPEAFPEERATLEELRSQHRELLRELRELLDSLDGGADRAELLVSRMKEHEDAEDAVLLRAKGHLAA